MGRDNGRVLNLLGIVRAKLCNYNPDDSNPEVLISAIGTLRAAKEHYGEIDTTTNLLFVAVESNLISLDPDLKSRPDAQHVREAALRALANLRDEIVKH